MCYQVAIHIKIVPHTWVGCGVWRVGCGVWRAGGLDCVLG